MDQHSIERALDDSLVGRSAPMRLVKDLIRRVAPSDIPVLIEGPTGTGKELVARALHSASGRSGAYVPFNVCAIPDGTFESALFGHAKGAFTGALHDVAGYLMEAHRGTLFLDEMGGLGLLAQAKLLRAIETGRFRPVDRRADQASSFRVVAATNVPLAQLAAHRLFREDLAQRLRGISISVPALAARREDIPDLLSHFLSQVQLDASVVDAAGWLLLGAHAWPGNVRELKHAIHCAATLSAGGPIGYDLLVTVLGGAPVERTAREASFSRAHLLQALVDVNWKVAEAARGLSIHRATFYRRLKRAGITNAMLRSRSLEGAAHGGIHASTGAQ